MKKKVRGTEATYVENKLNICDLVELAQSYQYVGNIPEKLGWSRASEIALLSRTFLSLWEDRDRSKWIKDGDME